jgi:hypothetical protein
LLNTDSKATAPVSASTCFCSVFKCSKSGLIAVSTTPERAVAALITKAAAIMITMSSAKPSNALAAGTVPVTIPEKRASNHEVVGESAPDE